MGFFNMCFLNSLANELKELNVQKWELFCRWIDYCGNRITSAFQTSVSRSLPHTHRVFAPVHTQQPTHATLGPSSV